MFKAIGKAFRGKSKHSRRSHKESASGGSTVVDGDGLPVFCHRESTVVAVAVDVALGVIACALQDGALVLSAAPSHHTVVNWPSYGQFLASLSFCTGTGRLLAVASSLEDLYVIDIERCAVIGSAVPYIADSTFIPTSLVGCAGAAFGYCCTSSGLLMSIDASTGSAGLLAMQLPAPATVLSLNPVVPFVAAASGPRLTSCLLFLCGTEDGAPPLPMPFGGNSCELPPPLSPAATASSPPGSSTDCEPKEHASAPGSPVNASQSPSVGTEISSVLWSPCGTVVFGGSVAGHVLLWTLPPSLLVSPYGAAVWQTLAQRGSLSPAAILMPPPPPAKSPTGEPMREGEAVVASSVASGSTVAAAAPTAVFCLAAVRASDSFDPKDSPEEVQRGSRYRRLDVVLDCVSMSFGLFRIRVSVPPLTGNFPPPAPHVASVRGLCKFLAPPQPRYPSALTECYAPPSTYIASIPQSYTKGKNNQKPSQTKDHAGAGRALAASASLWTNTDWFLVTAPTGVLTAVCCPSTDAASGYPLLPLSRPLPSALLPLDFLLQATYPSSCVSTSFMVPLAVLSLNMTTDRRDSFKSLLANAKVPPSKWPLDVGSTLHLEEAPSLTVLIAADGSLRGLSVVDGQVVSATTATMDCTGSESILHNTYTFVPPPVVAAIKSLTDKEARAPLSRSAKLYRRSDVHASDFGIAALVSHMEPRDSNNNAPEDGLNALAAVKSVAVLAMSPPFAIGGVVETIAAYDLVRVGETADCEYDIHAILIGSTLPGALLVSTPVPKPETPRTVISLASSGKPNNTTVLPSVSPSVLEATVSASIDAAHLCAIRPTNGASFAVLLSTARGAVMALLHLHVPGALLRYICTYNESTASPLPLSDVAVHPVLEQFSDPVSLLEPAEATSKSSSAPLEELSSQFQCFFVPSLLDSALAIPGHDAVRSLLSAKSAAVFPWNTPIAERISTTSDGSLAVCFSPAKVDLEALLANIKRTITATVDTVCFAVAATVVNPLGVPIALAGLRATLTLKHHKRSDAAVHVSLAASAFESYCSSLSGSAPVQTADPNTVPSTPISEAHATSTAPPEDQVPAQPPLTVIFEKLPGNADVVVRAKLAGGTGSFPSPIGGVYISSDVWFPSKLAAKLEVPHLAALDQAIVCAVIMPSETGRSGTDIVFVPPPPASESTPIFQAVGCRGASVLQIAAHTSQQKVPQLSRSESLVLPCNGLSICPVKHDLNSTTCGILMSDMKVAIVEVPTRWVPSRKGSSSHSHFLHPPSLKLCVAFPCVGLGTCDRNFALSCPWTATSSGYYSFGYSESPPSTLDVGCETGGEGVPFLLVDSSVTEESAVGIATIIVHLPGNTATTDDSNATPHPALPESQRADGTASDAPYPALFRLGPSDDDSFVLPEHIATVISSNKTSIFGKIKGFASGQLKPPTDGPAHLSSSYADVQTKTLQASLWNEIQSGDATVQQWTSSQQRKYDSLLDPTLYMNVETYEEPGGPASASSDAADQKAKAKEAARLASLSKKELLAELSDGVDGLAAEVGLPSTNDRRLAKANAGVSETSSLMNENIQRMHERGDRLRSLADRTADMHNEAAKFGDNCKCV